MQDTNQSGREDRAGRKPEFLTVRVDFGSHELATKIPHSHAAAVAGEGADALRMIAKQEPLRRSLRAIGRDILAILISDSSADADASDYWLMIALAMAGPLIYDNAREILIRPALPEPGMVSVTPPPPSTVVELHSARRLRTMALANELELPDWWSEALPEIRPLPGRRHGPARSEDFFLALKRQEMLLRSGDIGQVDPGLVAEAVARAADEIGPRRLAESARRLFFALTWRHFSPGLRFEVASALDQMETCLAESLSVSLFEHLLAASWNDARRHAEALDPALALPEECPWPSVDLLVDVARQRLREEPGV